jgi:dimethylargininase
VRTPGRPDSGRPDCSTVIALTRPVSPQLGACELSYLERVPIDPDRAAAEHAAYEAELVSAGCEIVRIPAAPDLPDAVFVEDTAVALPEVAVVTRPGAPSRRPECEAVAAVLGEHRPLRQIEAPGTLDGGDVLVMGRTVYVGATARTNRSGATQLERILGPLGYVVRRVPVRGCLHLKTAVTRVADDTVLLNPGWVEAHRFAAQRRIPVDPAEPHAANVLAVGDRLLVSAAHPRTAERLRAEARVEVLDVSELAKAEAGLTCCSVLLT